MNTFAVVDFKEKVTRWINGIRNEWDNHYRTVKIVSGDNKRLDIVYSVSYMRAIRDDATLMDKVSTVLKWISPATLITGNDYLKEDTRCILTLQTSYIMENKLKMKYDISVCNGSVIHKKVVKEMEKADLLLGLKSPIGFTISDDSIIVDFSERVAIRERGIVSIKDIIFKGSECTLLY